MAELPTEEELEKLYHEKGHDALVWYAWRNALRALLLLGRIPLRDIWGERAVARIYSVCRISLILAQWNNILLEKSFLEDICNATDIKAAADTEIIAASVAEAVISAASIAAFSIEDKLPSNIMMFMDNTYIHNIIIFTANREISSPLVFNDLIKTAKAIIVAASNDFTFLCQQPKFHWSHMPLWLEENLNESLPQKIVYWENSLLNDLRELGLEFLADDLNNLWRNKPLEIHAKNYIKEYSEAEINDPLALSSLILDSKKAGYIHAVRVLLVGPGGAGKSSLVDRLQGSPVEYVKKITFGINYQNHQPLNLYETFPYLQPRERPLDLYLWDFGGQTIFHGLHSAFLHENCVYVLVVDSRHEQAPDEWLYQIRHLAGSQAKVQLVTNWYEACETRQNEARLLREFPDLINEYSFFYFSCHDPEATGLQYFVNALEKLCRDSQRIVLKETLVVNEILQERYQQRVFLEAYELDEIITDVTKRIDYAEILTSKLEQLGFLVRVDGDDQHYCLKPTWAVDHAYAVLYSPMLREAKGVLQLKALQREFKGKIDAQHLAYLVEFLQVRSLCRKLENGSGYFFPDAARADEPPEVSRLLVDGTRLAIRFDLPYLPLGFHARLVHKLFVPHSEVGIHDPQDIWRQGFILRAGTTSQAVVHYLLRKNVIEMVLTGDLKAFSALLREFYTHLKAVLVSPNGIRPEQIHPSVLFNQQSFSVHSGEGLVKVLAQINSYDQLFQEVRKMASTGNITSPTGKSSSATTTLKNPILTIPPSR